MKTYKRGNMLLCLLLAFCIASSLLAGCSASSAMDTASSSVGYAAGAVVPEAAAPSLQQEFGYDGMMDMTADTKYSAETPLDDPNIIGRKIIRTVELSMETLEFDALLPAISEEVEAVGGYLESSSVEGSGINSKNNRRYARLVARVPQEKLNGFLTTIGEIGHITYRAESSNDVTLEYVDIDSRKRTLEVEQERLLTLLETASDLDSIIRLEERLSEVRYQLESYTSKLRTIDSEVNYSTVNIDLQEVRRITDPVPVGMGERISTGFAKTLRSISEDAQDFVVWFVINLPYFAIWFVILLVLVLLIRLLVRLTARPGKKRAVPPAPSAMFEAPEAKDPEEK